MSLRRIGGENFELVPPRCALDRLLDLEEVREMLAADEQEIARDELLYLVGDCHGFLEAHNVLAEIALEAGDVSLARGHFGYAYENALAALPEKFTGRLPAGTGYNAAFFASGCGLARCLIALKKPQEGRDVLNALHALDSQCPDVLDLLRQLDERERVGQTGSS